MTRYKTKNGSALLIVLGMLAFLIISAVAFSAYMRYARLPSSYLRRSASSRQLVKAAMAEAIDALDRAIGNNPHPGLGDMAGCDYPLRNVWCNRVLIGDDKWQDPKSESDYIEKWDRTVSPLCLEALAYIPPTLVNEVRCYSRLSPTAEWKSFDFDVGRYAFCVLDVSDYFDINRMFADQRRSSASNARVSLSYLFEDGFRHTGAGSGASQWDTFMEQFREVDSKTREISFDSKYPLISVADFNLALGQKGSIGKMRSPFVEYITSSGSSGSFYGVGKNGNEAADDMLRRMTFVTDGLFPGTDVRTPAGDGAAGNSGASEKIYDLSDGKNQPFKLETMSMSTTPPNTLSKLIMDQGVIQGEAKTEWTEFVGQIGMVSLYDYLDADRIPMSLAIPTVERVPMICAVEPNMPNIDLAVRKEFEPAGTETSPQYDGVVTQNEQVRRVRKTVRYKIDNSKFAPGLMGSGVKALTVFPFSRKDDKDGTFTVDGQLKLFFSSQEMTLRTGVSGNNQEDILHLQKDVKDSGHDVDTGITSIKLTSNTDISPKDAARQTDAVQQHDFLFGGEAPKIADSYNNNPLLTVEFEWDQTPQKDQNGNIIGWTPSLEKVMSENKVENIKTASTAFPALMRNGQNDPQFRNAESLKQMIVQGQGKTVHFNCAIWLRIKDQNGKVVDMVPACMQDDVVQNSVPLLPPAQMAVPGDSAFPLMRFETGVQFDFSIAGLEKLAGGAQAQNRVSLKPASVMVADPRYNHSPEDWFASNGELTSQSWLTWLEGNVLGKDGRDRDIFMATSDAGYLQSVYELAMLPRTKTPNNGGSVSDLLDNQRDDSRRNFPSSFSDTRNQRVAWMSYDPFDRDWEAFDELPFVNDGTGFKVNPYSDSTNILMSVFANTPLDWRCASTNVTENGVDFSSMNVEDFNKKYAMNAYSQTAKIEWEDLTKVAGKFKDMMRSNGMFGSDWQTIWRKTMSWRETDSGDGARLCGIDLKSDLKFWDVDKKYLYGFWKECFAAKQQLFLVFVRAEPMMMGSGAAGHTPPQLGGRAMALVWRDPKRTKNNNTPHKTRVLFYRQFD